MSNQSKAIKQSKVSLDTSPSCKNSQIFFSGPVILSLDPVIVFYFVELLKDILKAAKEVFGAIDTPKTTEP